MIIMAGHQYHHGVTKNIVEGIGGVLVGAAVVLFATSLYKSRQRARQAPTEQEAAPAVAKPARKATAKRTKTIPTKKTGARQASA